MKKIDSKQLKTLWLDFFKEKGFAQIDPSSVVPVNDATVLFITAGMQPLVPYLLGEKHPAGTKLVNYQKCIRTNDIDEVGDASHCTFFEMLGCWTLGECDKAQMIANSYEFLTSERFLGIDKNRLAVSVFAGDEITPKDELSHDAWKIAGLDESQIFYLPKENNWWALGGGVGPCGPDTEIFFDTGKPKCCDSCSPACDCGKYLEIWNDVFMQYNVKNVGEKVTLLGAPNIDTGMGIERTVCVLNGEKSVYDTGIFKTVICEMEKTTSVKYLGNEKAYRIIADHIRAAAIILGDGVYPKNVGQGYVLRRLLRRAINYARDINLNVDTLYAIAEIYIEYYKDFYPQLEEKKDSFIMPNLKQEVVKFERTLADGRKEFEKVVENLQSSTIDGKTAFRLYDTFGFPLELTKELAMKRGIIVDEESFNHAFEEHQNKSRMGGAQLFKGGLADQSDGCAKLHTATHLMLAGLRKMFGKEVLQKGSNITPERLRFDFNLDHKMTDDELVELEKFVNDAINQKIEVVCEEMSIEAARCSGALGVFDNKYGEKVKVYTIGNISKEMCGGPHAKNTSELVKFTIQKEESCGSGIRRIKATIN